MFCYRLARFDSSTTPYYVDLFSLGVIVVPIGLLVKVQVHHVLPALRLLTRVHLNLV